MGFKSKSKETNICNPFKVGGLIFESEEDYQLLKDIDKNISQIVKSVEDGSIDIKEYFNKIKIINIKESYYDAMEEMEGLFKNAINLLCYQGTIFDIDYKVGCCFFNRINIIEYYNEDDL